MISIEYSKSISEVLDILNHTRKEDVDKISPEFIRFLNNNKSKIYTPNLDHTKRLKDMELSETTIGILSVINSKFWCTPQQRELFDNRVKENENKYQQELRKRYNPDNVFNNKNEVNYKEKINEKYSLVEYKESLFIKFINIIKKLFNK